MQKYVLGIRLVLISWVRTAAAATLGQVELEDLNFLYSAPSAKKM